MFIRAIAARSILLSAASLPWTSIRPCCYSYALISPSQAGSVTLRHRVVPAARFGVASAILGNRAKTGRSRSWSSAARRSRFSSMASFSAGTEAEDYDSSGGGGSHRSKRIGRVALLQFHVTADKGRNLRTAAEFLSRAKAENAEMAVLPEIWNSPYATSAFSEYAEVVPSIGETDAEKYPESPSVKFLMEKARVLNLWIIGGSIPERSPAKTGGQAAEEELFNTCICIDPEGRVVAKHRKVHLFDIDVPGKITFKESDTLSPGTVITTFDAGEPLGRIGVGVCYDIRFPELAQCMVERGCRILVYPGAFNLTTGPAHWELLQRARAVDGQCFVLTASPARSPPPPPNEEGEKEAKYPHYSAWGHSTAVSPWGEILATCDEKAHVLIVDLDMSKVDEMRQNIPTMLQKRKDLYSLTDIDRTKAM